MFVAKFWRDRALLGGLHSDVMMIHVFTQRRTTLVWLAYAGGKLHPACLQGPRFAVGPRSQESFSARGEATSTCEVGRDHHYPGAPRHAFKKAYGVPHSASLTRQVRTRVIAVIITPEPLGAVSFSAVSLSIPLHGRITLQMRRRITQPVSF